MSNVGSVTKFFPTVNEGYTAVTTAALTANPLIIPLSSVSGLTDGSVFVGIINPADAVKKQVFTGTVDIAGSRITGCVWTRGTSLAGHPIGTTVVDYTTGTAINMISKGILKEHNQSGNHTNVTATSVTTGALTVSTTVNVPDDSITLAKLNTAAFDAWDTWTPTLGGLTLGNGTRLAKYKLVGKSCHVYFSFTFGTTSDVTGDITVSLPIQGAPQYGDWDMLGSACFHDIGSTIRPGMVMTQAGGANFRMRWINANGMVNIGDAWNTTTPFDTAPGDEFSTSFTYEVA